MSESSLRRLTLGSGEKVAAWKAEEAEQASAPAQRGEEPRTRRVAAQDAIREQANVSTDGTMIRIREQGWKEVKIGAISRVEVQLPVVGRQIQASGREPVPPDHAPVAGMRILRYI